MCTTFLLIYFVLSIDLYQTWLKMFYYMRLKEEINNDSCSDTQLVACKDKVISDLPSLISMTIFLYCSISFRTESAFSSSSPKQSAHSAIPLLSITQWHGEQHFKCMLSTELDQKIDRDSFILQIKNPLMGSIVNGCTEYSHNHSIYSWTALKRQFHEAQLGMSKWKMGTRSLI